MIECDNLGSWVWSW